MEKKRIEVTINGQLHAFVTSDGEEYIRGLADYLNEKISEVASAPYGNLLSTDKKYIIAAMNILDDYYKILSKYEQLTIKGGKDRGESAEQVNVSEYMNKIKALEKENEKLKDKLGNLEYELEYVQNLYEELKREYENKA